MLLTVLALGVLARLEWRDARLSSGVALAVCVVVLAIATFSPLRRSHDVWSYAVLGRIVTVHEGNPYVDSPVDFPDDPYYARIAPQWRRGVTVYGPLWVGVTAAVTKATGESATATRLVFQGLAAVAVGASLVLVHRATRDGLAVALLGLNPMTVLYLVNGGHSDALMGVLLVAAALALRRRPVSAAVLIGAAALVKLVALLALVAAVVWLWTNRGTRAAVRVLAVGTATVAAGYLVYGRTAAIRALRGAQDIVSAPSLWRPWRDHLVAEGRRATETGLGRPALLLVLAIAAVVVLVWRRSPDPSSSMAAALFVFVAAASYTLIWYLAWLVPLVALRVRSRLALVVGAYTAVALVSDEHPAGPSQGPLDHLLDHADDLLRVVAVVGLVVLMIGPSGRFARRAPLP
jgi:alpha-1,6-mannosyltransferase